MTQAAGEALGAGATHLTLKDRQTDSYKLTRNMLLLWMNKLRDRSADDSFKLHYDHDICTLCKRFPVFSIFSSNVLEYAEVR